MEPLICHTGITVPLLRPNIDTDAIIPSREMKRVSRKGLSDGLFAGWRYKSSETREENPEFVLNQSRYKGCSILLTGPNFGCGSSREHAVWALAEFGFRTIVAPSFGHIFMQNCVRNGIAPITLSEQEITSIATALEDTARATVDLNDCILKIGNRGFSFSIDKASRGSLLRGLDPISDTLTLEDTITAFESSDRKLRPWVYPEI